MGKAPALIGERLERLVTQVAFHPRLDHIAIGYDDGAVHLAKLEGPPTLELRGPTGAAVTGLAWSPSGSRVAAGDDQGEALVLDTPL
jgi:WD40 repeat protein